jgi:hypothetical protein
MFRASNAPTSSSVNVGKSQVFAKASAPSTTASTSATSGLRTSVRHVTGA